MVKLNSKELHTKRPDFSDCCEFARSIGEKYGVRRTGYLGFIPLIYNLGRGVEEGRGQQINNFISNVSMQVKVLQGKNYPPAVASYYNTVLNQRNIALNNNNYINLNYQNFYTEVSHKYGGAGALLSYGGLRYPLLNPANGILSLIRITNLLPLLQEGGEYHNYRVAIDHIRLQLKEYLERSRDDSKDYMSSGSELSRKNSLIQKKYMEEYIDTVLKDKVNDRAEMSVYNRIYETLSLLNQEVSSQRALYQSAMTDIYRSANHDYGDVMDKLLLTDRGSFFLEGSPNNIPIQRKGSRHRLIETLYSREINSLKHREQWQRHPGVMHIPWKELGRFELKSTLLQEELLKRLWFNKNVRGVAKAVNEYFTVNNYNTMSILSSLPLSVEEIGAYSREKMFMSLMSRIKQYYPVLQQIGAHMEEVKAYPFESSFMNRHHSHGGYKGAEMSTVPMEYKKDRKAYAQEAERKVSAARTSPSELKINKDISTAKDVGNVAIDFEKMADRIYDQIEKKLRFERQRSGL